MALPHLRAADARVRIARWWIAPPAPETTPRKILDPEGELARAILADLRRVRSLVTIEPLAVALADGDIAPLARSCVARARLCWACRVPLGPVAAVAVLEPLDDSGRLAVAPLCGRCLVDPVPLRERLRIDLGIGNDRPVHPTIGRA